jgi:2-C-methyl-D-erythritol 4-phosphate cytidylyltransferase
MPVFAVVIVTAPPFTPAAEASAALAKIDGREVLLRTVELFLNRDEIKQIQLVVSSDVVEDVKKKHGAHLGFSGVKLAGAAAKFGEQIAVAAQKLASEATHVLVHDAARCIVPYTDLEALMALAASKSAATALCCSIRNGMAELDEGGNPVGIVPSSRFTQLVTPMLLSKQKFLELAGAKREPHGSELSLLKGSALNIRVGGAGEGNIAKAMLNMLPKPKLKGGLTPFEEAQW